MSYQNRNHHHYYYSPQTGRPYSTVTDFARFLG